MKTKSFQRTLGTIGEPYNDDTIWDQGGSWPTPLKNCLGAMFSLGFKKASSMLGKGNISRNLKRHETKELRNKTYSKGKEKIIQKNNKNWTQ